MNKYCKFEKCAYSHESTGSNPRIQQLDKEAAELKCEIFDLKEVNVKLDNSIRSINEQLSNTFSIVFERIMNLEKALEEHKSNKAAVKNTLLEAEAEPLEKAEPDKDKSHEKINQN